MKKVSVFNCRIRRKQRGEPYGDVFQLVREYVVGEGRRGGGAGAVGRVSSLLSV